MKSPWPLIALSLIALLLTASAANGQSTITIPCSRVDEFVHGAIDVPAGAAVEVSAVTVSQLIARVGGPKNFAVLMRTPEGRRAVKDAGAISDEEFAWCKQRVEQELARRQRAVAERPAGPFDQQPSRPVGELMATHDACVRAADAAGPQYSEAWKQRFASCLDARAPHAVPSRPSGAGTVVYLALPPPGERDVSAGWDTIGTFDTAWECTAARARAEGRLKGVYKAFHTADARLALLAAGDITKAGGVLWDLVKDLETHGSVAVAAARQTAHLVTRAKGGDAAILTLTRDLIGVALWAAAGDYESMQNAQCLAAADARLARMRPGAHRAEPSLTAIDDPSVYPTSSKQRPPTVAPIPG